MKYRVIRIGDRYYPQLQSWYSFFWRYFYKDGLLFDSRRFYHGQGEAIGFIHNKIVKKNHRKNKHEVVWEKE